MMNSWEKRGCIVNDDDHQGGSSDPPNYVSSINVLNSLNKWGFSKEIFSK